MQALCGFINMTIIIKGKLANRLFDKSALIPAGSKCHSAISQAPVLCTCCPNNIYCWIYSSVSSLLLAGPAGHGQKSSDERQLFFTEARSQIPGTASGSSHAPARTLVREREGGRERERERERERCVGKGRWENTLQVLWSRRVAGPEMDWANPVN